MNPADILALLPVKPEEMTEIATITYQPTWESIKDFQESIQDQSISITTCDHNLVFLGIVIWASYFDTLNNRKLFAPAIDPGPTAINATGTANQITGFVHLYKYEKEKPTTYCEFYIILI